MSLWEGHTADQGLWGLGFYTQLWKPIFQGLYWLLLTGRKTKSYSNMWTQAHSRNLCTGEETKVTWLAQHHRLMPWLQKTSASVLPKPPGVYMEELLSTWQQYRRSTCPQHSICLDPKGLKNALAHLTLLFFLQGQLEAPLHWPH